MPCCSSNIYRFGALEAMGHTLMLRKMSLLSGLVKRSNSSEGGKNTFVFRLTCEEAFLLIPALCILAVAQKQKTQSNPTSQYNFPAASGNYSSRPGTAGTARSSRWRGRASGWWCRTCAATTSPHGRRGSRPTTCAGSPPTSPS